MCRYIYIIKSYVWGYIVRACVLYSSIGAQQM